jgi:hypothetical protein
MKLPMVAFAGAAAAALAGTAIAANQKMHRMDVPLPDGSVVHVEYVGDVAPKVSVAPLEPGGLWATTAFPDFGNFDRMFEQIDQQMRQVEQLARQPAGNPGLNIASYGSLPAGMSSVSVVSTSNGGVTCTRTTEVVSQGAGKPPKVTTNVSGNCGATPQVPPQALPKASSAPIDHT